MSSLRLTQRQWRIYLAVWLVAVAAVVGVLAGMIAPRLLARSSPQTLVGDIVINPPVAAPDFTLQDQQGSTISLSGIRGSVVALTFLDTQCLNLCPLQASLLGTVQSDLGRSTPLTLVVVSVRPEADTPAAIAGFAGSHGLKGPYHWLNGTRSQLAGVWDSYGISVLAASGDLAHSSVIYLIDRRGYERVAFADVPQPSWVEDDVRLLTRS
ncbi:MAG TPA: SCO family protein [Candidatus Dormibacteraeota bacterium]|nr:SCO family protein [Candidatus Dormibacteraeota bacterium]